MPNIAGRRRWAPWQRRHAAALAASLAAVAVAATACAGGTGSSSSARGAGGSGPPSAATGGGGCNSQINPYGNSKKAKAPGVTAGKAGTATLPKGKPGKNKPRVTMGTKNFPESILVGQLYTQALRAKGFTVSFTPKVGSSEVTDRKFQSGEIDAYPEYLGEIASTLADKPSQGSATATYRVAKSFEQSQRNATIFQQTPYQNVDVLFVQPGFCKKHHLHTIGDLRGLGDGGVGVIFTAQQAAKDRYEGYEGLKKAYGLPRARFYGVAVGGETLDAVEKGTANVGDAFSTTSKFVQAVNSGRFVTLKDPKHIMGFQHVAPVVKQSTAQAEGPAFAKTLNWVDSKLTQPTIQKLDDTVQLKGKSPADVAKHFLASQSEFANG
jgi:osmoprotectant transport system substrate-binding protein